MFSTATDTGTGLFGIHIANGRTKTPEEWAQEIADKVLFIAASAPPGIREQAHAFKDQLRTLVEHNLAAAIHQERTWCAAMAEQEGAVATAQAIRAR